MVLNTEIKGGDCKFSILQPFSITILKYINTSLVLELQNL